MDKKPTTVVISEVEAKLAADRAQVEAELGRQGGFDVKKVVIIGLVVTGVLAVVGVLMYFGIGTLTGQHNPKQTNSKNEEGTSGRALENIEGYSCQTKLCFKVTDLTEETMLVRDTAYYVYNRETETAVKTTIEAVEYRSFVPFYWGESLLLVLERATGRQGLYSVSANRGLSAAFNYTSFNRDIESEEYKGMEWVEGRYILAKIADETRLIDIITGAEVVRAAERIFANEDFVIGYEVGGQRRIYTRDGSRILVVEAGSWLAIYEHYLVNITGNQSFDIYDDKGVQLKQTDEFYKTLRDELRATKLTFAEALRGLGGAFIVAD